MNERNISGVSSSKLSQDGVTKTVASFFLFNYPYGTNRNVKIFIGSDDSETRKEFSELCGNKKIKQFSVNTNAENPASSNTGATTQPLIISPRYK